MMAFSSGLRVPTISARGERGRREAEGAAAQPSRPRGVRRREEQAPGAGPRAPRGALWGSVPPRRGVRTSRAGSTSRFTTRESRGRGPRAAGGLKEKGPSAGGSLGEAGGRRRYLLRPRKGMVEAGHIGHDGLLVGPSCVDNVCKRTRGVRAGGHGGGSEPLGAPGSAASSSPGWGPAGRPPRGTCRGTRGCEIVPPRCTAPDRGQHASSAPKRRGLGGPGVFCWCCSAPKATAPQPRAPGAAYPRRPASWGCPGTSPPPRRRCSGWSRGRPGGRETLGGRPGLVAHGSVPAGGKGRGRAVGRGRG